MSDSDFLGGTGEVLCKKSSPEARNGTKRLILVLASYRTGRYVYIVSNDGAVLTNTQEEEEEEVGVSVPAESRCQLDRAPAAEALN